MDKVLGIIFLFLVIAAVIYFRSFVLSSRRRNYKTIYKDLRVHSSLGGNPGVMVYVISIATVIIGPFSYELIPLNDVTYVLMNVLAGVFFSLFYPPFAPITGFATIDVIEIKGTKYCIVGRVMNRKYKVISIIEDQKFEITAESRRQRLIFEVTNRPSDQK
jgi:hypothetical protein